MKRHLIMTLLFTLAFALATTAMAQIIVRGDSGSQVQRIQQMLVTQGYLVDKADGIFGNNTEYSVRAFQKDKQLQVTGKVDGVTLRAIEANNKLFAKGKASGKATSAVRTNLASRNVRSALTVSRYGDRGRLVEDLQVRLASSGFSPGTIDGVFGNATKSAIERFQAHKGLKATGELDGSTVRLLSEEPGIPTKYKRMITMHASAYSAQDPGNSPYTARGNLLRRGYVSVDPGVIPLGTPVYVEGYGYAIADDTGGAIVGNRIDLAMDSHGEAIQFGRRTVKVYVL